MIQVILFSRKGCHLCEDVLRDLNDLGEKYPLKLEVIDIDSDHKLLERFDLEIPVVQVGPYLLKAPFSRQELEVTLAAQSDRARHIDKIKNPPAALQTPASRTWSRADSITYWIARHYLAMFNLFVFIYVGIPFLAPVMMRAGAETPANVIYKAYSAVCHQLAFRSFFLFGEQPVYPRSSAGVAGLESFAQATGLGETNSGEDIFTARNFVGNDRIGYKVALCERDVAIYGAILLFGVLFALSGHRIRPLHWVLWVLIGLGPIGLDGFSQLFSQPPFNFIPYRESTPALRVLTGALFGFTTAWFGYPLVESTMKDTRSILDSKLRRIKKQPGSPQGLPDTAD